MLLQHYPDRPLATHAMARELLANAAPQLDAFMSDNGALAPEVDTCLAACIASLPTAVQQTMLLDVSVDDFAA